MPFSGPHAAFFSAVWRGCSCFPAPALASLSSTKTLKEPPVQPRSFCSEQRVSAVFNAVLGAELANRGPCILSPAPPLQHTVVWTLLVSVGSVILAEGGCCHHVVACTHSPFPVSMDPSTTERSECSQPLSFQLTRWHPGCWGFFCFLFLKRVKFSVSQGTGSLLGKPAFWNSAVSDLGYFEGPNEGKGSGCDDFPGFGL